MVRSPRQVRLGSSLVGFNLGVVALLAIASPAAAQSSDPSHWGARVSLVKAWTMADQIRKLLGNKAGDEIKFDGSEFEIGFVRGSKLGGDWGVSLVKKPFKDGSGEIKSDQDCFNQAQTICRPRLEVSATKDMMLTGVEVHWFIRFVNIKQRVQIGLNVGGGIAQTSGQVIKTTDRFEPTGFNQNGPTGFRQVHEVETTEAKNELFPYFPQFKLEVVGSVIVAPKFKIQIAHGLNFPAICPRIMGVVFF